MFLFWWGTVVGFGFGAGFGVVGAYFAELFPEQIRALAGGFCFNVGRIGAVIAPFTVGVLGQTYGLKVGLMVASATFILGAAILCFMPETAAKSTQQAAMAQSAAK
jgi:MFS family permease